MRKPTTIEIIEFEKENMFSENIDIRKLINDINFDQLEDVNIFTMDLTFLTKLIKDDTFKIKSIFLKRVMIFIKEIMNKDKNVVQISQDIFVSYFGKKNFQKYKNILINTNIIVPVPYIIEGKQVWYVSNENPLLRKPRRFKFSKEFLTNDELALLVIDENKTIKPILDLDPELEIKLNKQDPRIVRTIKEIKINVKDALISELDNYYNPLTKTCIKSLLHRMNNIFIFRHKRYIKQNGMKTDRLFTSINGLSNISRKHLNIQFYTIDLSNSQPAILADTLYQLDKSKLDLNYIIDTQNGDLYKRFYNLYEKGTIEETHKITKQNFYESVLFGFNTTRKINKEFKVLYPNTWEYIYNIQKDNIKKQYNQYGDIINEEELKDNVNLAGKLQNKEASIFLPLKPKKSKYTYTCHDSISVDRIEDVPGLIEEIKSKFKLKITLTIE